MDFDALVIGGGHAGIEAGLALSRLGYTTLLITQHLDTIGRMSCNPAVGGMAKGNMVREIDALGGQMGKLIDATMIQFRILNRRKGPAVQSPRAQADKYAYQALAKKTLEEQKGLTLFMDTVTDFLVEEDGSNGFALASAGASSSPAAGERSGRRIAGVVTERGKRFTARTVVLTTGTFLNGKVFIGEYTASSGRLGEPAALGLDKALRALGFSIGRMKTGTPARIHRDSIDFSRVEAQFGDDEILPFAFGAKPIVRQQLACYITYTSDDTKRIIRDNMHRSPLYSGKIEGIGPRYCPSIEDKVMKFPHRERHQIFIEPEGADTKEMYLNGMSSSLPEDVQTDFIHSVPGLEHAQILRPGYAVEYDFLDPIQLSANLETKLVRGLFVAGQTNGTSGYEEAAGQGLVAGLNAARYLAGEEPIILSRATAYLGVLIDDLVTLGTKEPYRMFTSRAEHRISLRHDSADARLFEIGYHMGLHDEESWERFQQKQRGIEEIKELLAQRFLSEKDLASFELDKDEGAETPERRERILGKSFAQLLKMPRVELGQLVSLDPERFAGRPTEWMHQVELDVKYEGYVARQEQQILRFQRMENMRIPAEFNYQGVTGLSNEAREKFIRIRPMSMGQAGRIPGVRVSDLAILMVHVARRPGQKPEEREVSEDFLESTKRAEDFIAENRIEVQTTEEDAG